MNRVLKRPMFRMGGAAEGITSGLDRPGYASGTTKYGIGGEGATFASDMITAQKLRNAPQETVFDKEADARARIDALNKFAPRAATPFGPGSLSGFLTSTGLNLLSATPRGNIFATAAGAAKDPFDAFTTAKGKESTEDRALKLAALEAAMSRGEKLSDTESAKEFEIEQSKQAVLDEKALQEYIYDRKADIEKIEGDYELKIAQLDGSKDKLNIEVTNDLITKASQSIFDTRQILDSGVKTVDGEIVPLSETDKLQLNETIKQNQLFLESKLGLPPEYVAVLKDENRYREAKKTAIKIEQTKRENAWLKANPQNSGENPRAYKNRMLAAVGEIDEYSTEADVLTQKYVRDQFYTYASGGRVGYQQGGGADMAQEPATMTQQTPVQELSYNELRARLPKDIDNEIVVLLANSKQALLDFANIQTQEDISSFNQQYDVNLTLPQGA